MKEKYHLVQKLIVVVPHIIVGAFIGTKVDIVIASLCIELCVITTAEPILLIMSATAVIGAIVAGNAPILEASKVKGLIFLLVAVWELLTLSIPF